MRQLAILLLLSTIMSGQMARSQTLAGGSAGTGNGITITNVAGLANVQGKKAGTIATVNDGNSSTDCTVGGGSTLVNCQYSGSTWAQLPASGAGGTAFSAVTGSTNTTAAMVIGTGASIGVSGSGAITATALTGSPAVTVGALTAGSGGALAGTFTGAPTLSGNVSFTGTPTFANPLALGTPSSITLTNATNLPVTGLSGLATGVGTFLGAPSSANLAAALTDSTGSGKNVFATSPTFLGTPDASGATQFLLPVAAGYTTSANGHIGFDSTNKNWHAFQNGADSFLFSGPVSGSYVNGNCVKLGVSANVLTLVDSGTSCATGSVTGSGLTVNNMLSGGGSSAIKLADGNGLTYAMGTITTDINPFNVTWTYNQGATAFSGIKFIATNTASAAGTKVFQTGAGANLFTVDTSANLVTPGSLTVSAGSSVAGIVALGGGTQASITTNSLTLSTQGSSAMTGYNLNYPAAAASGILNWTNNTNQVNAAFLTSAANGDVITGNGSGWAKLAGNASGTKCLTEDASGNSSWGTCGGAAALSGITAAIASNTIANGNNGLQIWNWAATTNQNQFQFGETTAATNGTLGSQYILSAKTLAGSTAVPLAVIGSLTGTQTLPTLHITPTWNTSGVVDAALLVNVTNSASGAASKLADFQVGAVSQWNVDKAGVSTQLGNANAPAFVATGTTAGFVDFPQGSTSTGTSPCNTATSICEQAPAAVTSYSITKPGSAPNIASFKQTDGCGSSNCTESFRISPNVLTVTSDFTTAANTNLQTITGLSVTMPASTSGTAIFHCAYNWSQATATAAVAFGIQGATTAPTRIEANATSFTNTTAETTGTLDNLTTTTATNVVSVAPSAITTIWKAVVDGTLEFPSNASPTVLNFMVSTATSGDAVTVKRGSYCKVDYK